MIYYNYQKKRKGKNKMWTRTLVRDNEKILISDYEFEWYVNDELVRSGLVDGTIDEDIEALIDEGFELIA